MFIFGQRQQEFSDTQTPDDVPEKPMSQNHFLESPNLFHRLCLENAEDEKWENLFFSDREEAFMGSFLKRPSAGFPCKFVEAAHPCGGLAPRFLAALDHHGRKSLL